MGIWERLAVEQGVPVVSLGMFLRGLAAERPSMVSVRRVENWICMLRFL